MVHCTPVYSGVSITFANNWDSDQALQNARPDLETLTLLFMKDFSEKKIILKKISRQ